MNIKKLLAIILVAVIAVSVFAGCDVITKNEERDYSQALAVIEYKGLTAEVSKGEFYESFNSYAYYYVYYYGYTVEETAEMILDSLAERELLILYVRDTIATEQGKSNTVAVEELLSDVEKNEAVKATNESMKSYYDEIYEELWEEAHIDEDTTDDDEDEEEEESEDLEPRATRPEVAEQEIDYEAQLTDDEKELKFFDRASQDESFLYGDDYTDEQKSFVKKAVSQLKKELSDNYKSYEYYLEAQYESQLLSKYQRELGDAYEKNEDAILNKFNSYVTKNKETFSTNTESNFQSALDDLTTLCYTPTSEAGYGYVYNILFKFSDAQSTALTNYSTDQSNEDAVAAYRDSLAQQIVTHQSNLEYDADAEEGATNSNAYIMDETDATKVKEFNALAVVAELEGKLAAETDFNKKLEIVKQYTYMYNDDSGMFDSDNDNNITNNNLGYLITPEGKTSSYVDEFTKLGRTLVTTGQGSYGYCVTDYGIHFMFVSYVVSNSNVADERLATTVEYGDYRLVTENGVDESELNVTLSDAIFEELKDTYQSNEYQIKAQSFISANKDDHITRQSKAWKKLMKELDEAYNS